jgi:hypothetical protein
MNIEWTTWKQRLQPITNLGIPLYLAIGNHEANTDGQLDGGLIFAQQWPNLPQNGPQGLVGQVYTFRYENAQFFCLNSDIYNDASRIGSNQRSWMTTILDTCSAPLKFAFAHEPAYPPSASGSSSLQRYTSDRNAFWQVLSTYHFAAYMCGHLHHWNRDFYGHANMPQDTTVRQIVDGTCGAPIQTGSGGEFYHFVVWDINGNRLTGRVYDNYNTLRDTFVYYGFSGIEQPTISQPISPNTLIIEPNPFSNQLTVRFETKSAPVIDLKIFSADGKLVSTIYSGRINPGTNSFFWHGYKNVSDGIYYVVLSDANNQYVKKVIKQH